MPGFCRGAQYVWIPNEREDFAKLEAEDGRASVASGACVLSIVPRPPTGGLCLDLLGPVLCLFRRTYGPRPCLTQGVRLPSIDGDFFLLTLAF